MGIESIKNGIGVATEHVGDAVSTVSNRVKSACRSCKYVSQSFSRGYNDLDTWNLGYSLASRSAAVMRAIAAAGPSSESEGIAEELLRNAEILDTVGVIDDLLLITDAGGNPDKTSEITGKAIAKYREAMEWYGKNVLADCAGISYEPPAPKFPDAIIAKARNGFVLSDPVSTRVAEMEVASSMLMDFANGVHGHPHGYHARCEHLCDYGKDWETEPLPLMVFMNLPAEARKWYADETGKKGRDLTPEDITLDFAAWLSDIVEASNAISDYAQWVEEDGYGKLLLVAPEDADECNERIEARFLEAWSWVAANLSDLWD